MSSGTKLFVERFTIITNASNRKWGANIMTFTIHHPSYYKKLKQNSRRFSIKPSKDNVSEVIGNPPTMETKVGQVGSSSISSTHTNPKEAK